MNYFSQLVKRITKKKNHDDITTIGYIHSLDLGEVM